MADIILPKVFTSPTHGQLAWEEVLAKVVWFMSLDSLASYDVIIGTDSEAVNGSSDFVSAIIVHKKGRGGVYFWGRQKIAHLNSMKQRIWQEATLSLNLAQRLVDDFAKMGLFDISNGFSSGLNLEIHVDIGPNGPTRELIADIVGMIRANGFKVAIKPSSWGASHVADRHV
ncbi:hypothetical protein A3A60_03640 [Candidatus Curtissbacteria bacterium RIFCSPLOWO2_01_FULL_42_26]|uniref:DUF458 domain-containing protein n=1 Tax=Candidatus Curtissbacteria bacterium RIFCSPLOWO2_01_FULL_42_26 TaxID=1797729 RepID=A0A1F5I3T4_9BACT|nr:MAG: hypothetical protein A3A60_03640 [Candidatus Curtissbacteria bacterium RIFCSPLOWO2_01_FULL_42_26]